MFRTTLTTIPAPIPYLFPDPVRHAHWREWLNAHHPPGLPRVGLAWSGRPTHPNDRRRSIRLETLSPLARTVTARFVSVQKPFPSVDEAVMAQFAGLSDISDQLTDFEDTAALVSQLDLLITVDTSVGHLAGALGKPVWIMLPKASDWRWLLERTDSPWYPSARLFRQRTAGDWGPVVDDLVSALETEQGRGSAFAAN